VKSPKVRGCQCAKKTCHPVKVHNTRCMDSFFLVYCWWECVQKTALLEQRSLFSFWLVCHRLSSTETYKIYHVQSRHYPMWVWTSAPSQITSSVRFSLGFLFLMFLASLLLNSRSARLCSIEMSFRKP
jgi:hypothetical protein